MVVQRRLHPAGGGDQEFVDALAPDLDRLVADLRPVGDVGEVPVLGVHLGEAALRAVGDGRHVPARVGLDVRLGHVLRVHPLGEVVQDVAQHPVRVVVRGLGPLQPCRQQCVGCVHEVRAAQGQRARVHRVARRGLVPRAGRGVEGLDIGVVVLADLLQQAAEDLSSLTLPAGVLPAEAVLPVLEHRCLVLEELGREVEGVPGLVEGVQVHHGFLGHTEVAEACVLRAARQQLEERRPRPVHVLGERDGAHLVFVVVRELVAFPDVHVLHVVGVGTGEDDLLTGLHPPLEDDAGLHDGALLAAVEEPDVVVLALVLQEAGVLDEQAEAALLDVHPEELAAVVGAELVEDGGAVRHRVAGDVGDQGGPGVGRRSADLLVLVDVGDGVGIVLIGHRAPFLVGCRPRRRTAPSRGRAAGCLSHVCAGRPGRRRRTRHRIR
ncbi:hypothetical protein EES45_08595 [Streptomyces sp. ADI97-07]|nr:hypothetical protein EES45_08595 [Streptomyces sp. ADI97-07]